MKILFINETWGMSGGQERYILQVGNGLMTRGHEVHLIFGRSEGEFADTLLAKFKTALIGNLSPEGVFKYAQEFNPDVVNLQNVYDSRLINPLSVMYPVTRFVHDHSTYCPGNSKYHFNSRQICPVATSGVCLLNAYRERCMTRRPAVAVSRIFQRQVWLKSLRELPLILCNSSYVKDRLVQNGIEAEKIVINNLFPGHPEMMLTSSIREQNNHEKKILFVGRLFKEKGVDLLIKAFSKVKSHARLQIVGDGWEKGRLVILAQDLEISHRVDFLGFKSGQELASFYAQCDLFVMPSIWPEPFGMVGLEAGLFRKPVIAFNVGGVSDWLKDDVNGLLMKKADVNFLKEGIERVLSDDDLRFRLGENGYNVVLKRFNLDSHLNVLEQAYARITK